MKNILIAAVSLLFLSGCYWPNTVTKNKIDAALVSISDANVACSSGDCASCVSGVRTASDLFSYCKDSGGIASSNVKQTINNYSHVCLEVYSRSLSDCNVAAKNLPDIRNGVIKLRKMANGGK